MHAKKTTGRSATPLSARCCETAPFRDRFFCAGQEFPILRLRLLGCHPGNANQFDAPIGDFPYLEAEVAEPKGLVNGRYLLMLSQQQPSQGHIGIVRTHQ